VRALKVTVQDAAVLHITIEMRVNMSLRGWCGRVSGKMPATVVVRVCPRGKQVWKNEELELVLVKPKLPEIRIPLTHQCPTAPPTRRMSKVCIKESHPTNQQEERFRQGRRYNAANVFKCKRAGEACWGGEAGVAGVDRQGNTTGNPSLSKPVNTVQLNARFHARRFCRATFQPPPAAVKVCRPNAAR